MSIEGMDKEKESLARIRARQDSVLVCEVCNFEVRRGGLKNRHSSFIYCPECKKNDKYTTLLDKAELEQQRLAEERDAELSKRLYCRNCQYIELAEEFPFDLPHSDPDFRLNAERRCPKCYSDNNINLSNVEMCRQCDEVPATQHGLCNTCAAQIDDSWQLAE